VSSLLIEKRIEQNTIFDATKRDEEEKERKGGRENYLLEILYRQA
jgi:hypothetical protein